jgi:transposase InsO family protein
MKMRTRRPSTRTNIVRASTAQVNSAEEVAQSWETWHKRFGHVGYSGLQRMMQGRLVDGFNVDERTPKPDCKACTESKQFVTPFPHQAQNRATRPGELTHIDLWGKAQTASIHGNQYYICFVDDYSRRVHLYFLKLKTDAIQKVKDYLTSLKTNNRQPRAIRVDGGGEFINHELRIWCQSQGVEIEQTAPYSPSQNGVAECMNRTLVELARAMITANNVPEFLWEQAIAHAAYVRNRTHTKAVNNKTPYKAWLNKRPNVSHLREFGAPVWILNQGPHVQSKLRPKSKQFLFVGFDDGSKSVLYYSAQSRKILTSRNFRFLTLPDHPSPTESIGILAPDVRLEGETEVNAPKSSMNPSEEHRSSEINKNEPSQTKRKRSDNINEDDTGLNQPRQLRPRSKIDYRRLQKSFPDDSNEAVLTTSDIVYAIAAENSLGSDEPKNIHEAKRSPEWTHWEEAIKIELEQLEKMGTWELVDRPADAVPIANKWVLTKKFNKLGELLKYKARLVAKGCAQRPGQDYNDTFSPVVRLETIRAILALVPIKKLKVQQMDVKGAYLNGILRERVLMRQPEGFGDGTDRVCRLIKTIYGLKQSGREWNRELIRRMKTIGFEALWSDSCVFIRGSGDDLELITVWVDDLLIFTTSDECMTKLKQDLNSVFELTDLGEPNKIVGIEITQTPDSITISQKQYIESILRREGMENCNPVSTPLDPNIKLEPNPEGSTGDRSNSYASLIGSLQYLATATRPDIACAVNRLGAYTANPSMAHYTAAKRLLRYVAGTKDYGITYTNKPHESQGKNLVFGYSDAGYANADDHKSISGYVFLSHGGAITWASKKQATIALSSTEAEYVALSEASREAMWLRALYEELGFEQIEPTLILGDNDGSIAMAKNPQFHKRAKHIDIRWHWVRERVKEESVIIKDCRDPQQTADILTKALQRPKFIRHVAELGLSRSSA